MLAAAALSLVAGPAKADPAEIQIVTQSFAPLQWDNAGKPDGYVTAYMLEVARRVGETIPLKIGAYEFLPWKRAMLLAETMPNVLFFSLSRTPEREDKFIWLGEVSPYGQNFYQLSTRPKIEADTVEDLRDQKVRIGVQDGSNLLSHLKQLGFEKTGNLVPITDFHHSTPSSPEIAAMTDQPITSLDVLDFWWNAGPAKWFAKDDKFDKLCRDRFLAAIEDAAEGKLDGWADTADGALALLILLDQFPRNVFRGSPKAFRADPKAVEVAEKALDRGFDRAFPKEARGFFYLPFEHAEDMAHQERSVDLCRVLGDTELYHYALIHLDVIRRFGRFPHRNAVLDRQSTPEEIAYLESGGFSA